MGRFLLRTIIGLAIGAFFIWLSAKDWPTECLTGDTRIEAGHLLVGDVSAPSAHTNLAAVASVCEPGEGNTGGEGSGGWLFELWWLLPYFGVLTLIHVLRVVRWKPLLDPIVELDLGTHNRIGAVGFMAMFLFPLRLGELVRPYLVKQHTGRKVRMSEVLATVVVERITDGLMVSLLLVAVLAFLPATDPATGDRLRIGALVALAIFIGASVLLAGTVWQRERTVRLLNATFGRLSKRFAAKIIDILDAFVRGLRKQPNARAFLWFLFLTAVYWAVNGVGVWLMVKAFYLPVDLVGAYAMMACVVVGMMIPNSPGNVGSFWYFLVLPAPLYGLMTNNTQAIAFGLAVWLCQLVQQTAFGAWFILRGRVSLSNVMEATRQDEASLAAETGPAAG